MMRRLLDRNEFVTAAAVIVLSAVTGAVNPAFFSAAAVFDVLRNAAVAGILSMGVLLVMLSGGIDVSFPGIAALSSYATVTMLIGIGYQGPVLLVYAMATAIGILLGLLNAALISWLKLPTLIVTLGTAAMFYGFNLFFVGSLNLFNLPGRMIPFSRASLVTVQDPQVGLSSLHPAVFLLPAAALLVWLFLNYTVMGRGVYAMGGDRELARRSGFNLRRIEGVIYGLTGALAGIAGVTQAVFARNANPAALLGSELDVIAAVVLGGAAITGGEGSVPGTLLGVAFVTIMKTSLVMMGIRPEWQKLFVGVALIAGTAVAAVRRRRKGPN